MRPSSVSGSYVFVPFSPSEQEHLKLVYNSIMNYCEWVTARKELTEALRNSYVNDL